MNIWAHGILGVLTGFLVIATLLPFSKASIGAIRGLDFPRQQYFLLAMWLVLVVLIFDAGWLGGAGVALLLAIAAVQLFYILKFTPLWWEQSVSASDAERADTARQVRLLAANVKQSNRDYARLATLIKDQQPDIVMAIETDQAWIDALKEKLGAYFPHWVAEARDNGYGICLLSKLELSDTTVRDLIVEGIPSIRTQVATREGALFRLYVVHPEPPVIDRDTNGRDSELAMVGLEAANDRLPAVVAGDLNDVAWSTTTRQFQRLSGLLDPRVGRGFFNTFSATMPWMRWPLDHLFHNPRFRLVEMTRLRKIGSDHFPMWFVLALADEEAQEISPGKANAQETAASKKMIRAERQKDRDPIGSDWEDG